MAKKIIWSDQAHNDKKNILEYWTARNNSTTYSIKLNILFNYSIRIISKYPKIGRPTDFGNVRAKIVKDYILFYEEHSATINILTIWDSRQNPEKLQEKFQ